MAHLCHIQHQGGDITIGEGHPLAIIAGPCVLEAPAVQDEIAQALIDTCRSIDLPLIFKASFDKANRSSVHSPRGPGVEQGLTELQRIAETYGLPICTDIHEPAQAIAAASVVDVLQIPAFLCRQTDLLAAAADTGRAVNVKKGQFMAPAEMTHVVTKLNESGSDNIMLTERGTFFGYHRLVNDFTGLGDLIELGRPVCFDVTHSTQLPGGGTSTTAGRPDRADLLARAATAAGVHALFIECHPNPEVAASDASTVQPLAAIEPMLREAASIRAALTREAAKAT